MVYYLKVYSPKNLLLYTRLKSVGDARCIDASYLNAKHKLECKTFGTNIKSQLKIFQLLFDGKSIKNNNLMVPLLYNKMIRQLQELGFNEVLNKVELNTLDRLLFLSTFLS